MHANTIRAFCCNNQFYVSIVGSGKFKLSSQFDSGFGTDSTQPGMSCGSNVG